MMHRRGKKNTFNSFQAPTSYDLAASEFQQHWHKYEAKDEHRCGHNRDILSNSFNLHKSPILERSNCKKIWSTTYVLIQGKENLSYLLELPCASFPESIRVSWFTGRISFEVQVYNTHSSCIQTFESKDKLRSGTLIDSFTHEYTSCHVFLH